MRHTDVLHREGIRGYVLAQDRAKHVKKDLLRVNKGEERFTAGSWRVETDEDNT
jgi:hypothetical protein